MSDQNPFQSSASTASNQENQQPQETQQQQEEKAAGGADKNQGDDSLYVSPSDAIMSPASQKLSSFKQRQINKYVHMDGKPSMVAQKNCQADSYRLINRNGSDSTRRALFARNMSAAKNADEESK
jgi:hypothetical protein